MRGTKKRRKNKPKNKNSNSVAEEKNFNEKNTNF